MALITWNESLSVNIKQIDDQHKIWVGLINSLHDAMKVGQGKAVTEKIIDEVVKYTSFHFDSEEKLFSQHGYPETAAHKKLHKDFVEQINKMKQDMNSGNSVLAIQVMEQLKTWLSKHIMGNDKKYAEYLNAKGVY